LLGVAVASRRVYNRQSVSKLLTVLALMVAAMARFRVQIFLPLLPGFLFLAYYARVRTKRLVCLAAGGVALGVSVLIAAEMQSPMYLQPTAKLFVGYNGITMAHDFAWVNAWPFSEVVFSGLSTAIRDPGVFRWVWQVVSMTAFVVLNMVGLPLGLATIAFVRSKQARQEWALYLALTLWLVVASMVGAMTLFTTYDRFSVGGEMLLHTVWYLLPLLGFGAWAAIQRVRRIGGDRSLWAGLGTVVLAGAFIVQMGREPSALEAQLQAEGPRFSANEWQALTYLHDETPANAVIISNEHLEPYFAAFSGIAGRAAYFEYTLSSYAAMPSGGESAQSRLQHLTDLWGATSSERFCGLLLPTPATQLVEYADRPLAVQDAACLAQAWTSPGTTDRVTIWNIER
jgi:hypothetical protein